jgi:hypothetical protein
LTAYLGLFGRPDQGARRAGDEGPRRTRASGREPRPCRPALSRRTARGESPGRLPSAVRAFPASARRSGSSGPVQSTQRRRARAGTPRSGERLASSAQRSARSGRARTDATGQQSARPDRGDGRPKVRSSEGRSLARDAARVALAVPSAGAPAVSVKTIRGTGDTPTVRTDTPGSRVASCLSVVLATRWTVAAHASDTSRGTRGALTRR